jgi:hypothetical protein
MIRLAIALWFACAGMALAAPVTVKSGEHEGFTRLVLDFGTAASWTVGRTLDGYELRIVDASPIFDLTQVFDIIGKSRLAAIWTDPASASLHVGIACACHAIPFEFRPGIIVIDLRDGPPPKGSSFEMAIDGSEAPALAQKPAPRPRARPGLGPIGYVWTDLALARLQDGPVPIRQIAPSSDPAMEPLRASLLLQLSRGAARGMVEMVLPETARSQAKAAATVPAVRMGLGELPGLTVGTGLPDHSEVAANGETCVPAAPLDVASWGIDLRVPEQMSDAMAGIIGEFDKPNPEAVARAVKFQLFLGFGVEALQLLRAFPTDLPDAALWRSLAHIMDDTVDPSPLFRGQTACETPASLWSVLTDPAPLNGVVVNKGAVLLAFSGLPLALRRHLGPRLADRFLDLGDGETAGSIRNAITRAPGDSGSEVEMLEAEIDLSNGDAPNAEARLVRMLAEPGPGTPEALVALVVARVAQDLPVDAAHVSSVEALVAEQSGSATESEARHALTLALAASGNFEGAFKALAQSPEASADVWRLLAKLGTDASLLAHAVLPEDQPLPDVPLATSTSLAERLLGFGLAGPALRWVGPESDAVLRASAQLARRDARNALTSLGDVETPEALGLRAQALRLLGDDAEAKAYADAGDPTGQRLALSRSRDWPRLAELQLEGWTSVIGALADLPMPSDAGPLAQGHQLADRSLETRAAIADLLAIVSPPKIFAP